MIFNGRTYSVLIVSSSEKFVSTITPLLTGYSCSPVIKAENIAFAKRKIRERAYDLIIINSPLADENGFTFAIDVTSSGNAVCLCLIKSEIFEETSWKLSDCGVYAVSKPTSSALILKAVKDMITTRERLRIAEEKSISLEERMREIKLVNRAKWLLIEHMKMTEDDAHHYIEKQAMNTSSTKREIAARIINLYV